MVIAENRRLPKPALTAIASVGWVVVVYLAYVAGYDSWQRTGFSIAVLTQGMPELGAFNQRYVEHPWLTLMHTVPGVLCAVLGPLQFMSPIRRRWTAIHRASGRVFLVIEMFSGLGAILMGFMFPVWGLTLNQGITLAAGVFMLFAFVKAFTHIRTRQIARHREWMIRGFAAGLGVALFRVLLNEVLVPSGVDFTTSWNIVVAISFPIIVAAAELWIRATRPKGRATAPVAAEISPAVG